MNIFSILCVKIRKSVISYLSDERVVVCGAVMKKFICQTINKLMDEFE
jgi:hypothetical protein